MLEPLQEYLKDEKLDAFLVMTKINREYLSGFTGSAGILGVTKNSVVLFVDSRYTLRAKKESDLAVRDIKTLPSLFKKAKRIGVEDRITLKELGYLKKQIKRVTWKTTSNLVETLRMRKTKLEQAAIEKGSRIIDSTFEHIKKYIHKYIHSTEARVVYEVEKHGKRLGAEGLAFDPIVAFGPNAASPHHFSSNTKIGRNNFLLLDFGFKVNGYHSDFTRTLFIGKPNRFQTKVYETVLTAQLKAIEKVQVGNKASLVDQTARKFIARKGFSKYFTHNTGHGVGLEIHELPNFSPTSHDLLEQNSVVTVEPGIYLPGKFGVRIEDMIVVANKPRILSRIPKDLRSMMI